LAFEFNFDPAAFFTWMPPIALAGLALIIGIAVWMIWRNISPAAPGIILGHFEIIGRRAGTQLQRRIEGLLVETPIFLNPEIEPKFKKFLIEDIDALSKKASFSKGAENPSNPGLELSAFRDQLLKYPLSQLARIVVTRERLFNKHVVVQWGRVEKPLGAYATKDETHKFSLTVGPTSQGTVHGMIYTFPQKWEVYRLGHVTVHLFLPDGEAAPLTEFPEWLPKFALYAPATVELKEIIKFKDGQLKEQKRENEEMRQQLAAATTEKDAYRRSTSGFSVFTGTSETPVIKKFGIPDFVAITLPTVVGFYVADYAKIQPVIGIFIGLMVGALLLARRWR